MVKIEKDGIVKTIEESLLGDYLVAGWKKYEFKKYEFKKPESKAESKPAKTMKPLLGLKGNK